MAISRNKLLKGMSGSLGKLITIKEYADKTVICDKQKKPTVPRTAEQKVRSLNFADAQHIARNMMQDQAIKAQYQSLCAPGKRPYNLIISELMKNNGKLPS